MTTIPNDDGDVDDESILKKYPTSLNGMAHIQLSVSNKYWYECRTFYYRFCHLLLGMAVVYDTDRTLYCVGGRTAVLISKSRLDTSDEKQLKFEQEAIGLHHFCFRMRSKQCIDNVYKFLIQDKILNGIEENDNGIALYKMIHKPQTDSWAKDYYSILLEDPCGIRIECNYVPNKGWLDPSMKPKLPIKDSWARL